MVEVSTSDKLCVCYIPSMDLRRINSRSTPYICELFESYPRVEIKTLPNTELVPTLLTGVYPHEHGIWQLKLKSNSNSSLNLKLMGKIPDIITTTFQCILHLFNPSMEGLAAIPSRRLRHFELKRFKYIRRNGLSKILSAIGDLESIFSIVGIANGKYLFKKKISELDRLLFELCSGETKLEFVELYFLDILQHWNLDNSSKISAFYKSVDNFVKNLHEKCQEKGTTLMILSDHGMEKVTGSIDIKRELSRLDLSEDEYSFFIEVPMARFWFHNDRARRKIVEMLSSIDNGTLLSYKDIHKYNVKFNDDKYGEVYFIADPGYIIFPHDFYHPLANLFLGLTDRQQRSRIFNPKHRGYHGYLPLYESEKGFMMVLDNNWTVDNQDADIIDVAPTILELLGYKKPDNMRGRCVFRKGCAQLSS